MKGVNREVILQAYDQDPETVVSLLIETFTSLEVRIQELESRTKKTPKTAISPQPVTKSLRGKAGRLTGGQSGHLGYTLHQVKTPHPCRFLFAVPCFLAGRTACQRKEAVSISPSTHLIIFLSLLVIKISLPISLLLL